MTDRDKGDTWQAGLTAVATRAYEQANDSSGGVVGLVRDAIESFGEARGSEAAASMAYYILFSLFPLLLALTVAGSFLLDRQNVFQQIVDLVTSVVPISQELIQENLRQVLELRGAVGIVSLVTALWSASGAFTVLTRNVNRAWSDAPPRGFLENRLVALGMVGSLAVLLIVSLLLSTTLNLLSRFQVPLLNIESLYGTPLWMALSNLVPWLFVFFLLMALYRWVPNLEVKGSAAFWAALVVALAWGLVANAFAWYVGSGLARYRLVYGSLGTVVALLFWIYLSSWLVIFGVHLSAAVARHAGEGQAA